MNNNTGGVIRRLDAFTASQIAAGEVVERPFSVVKELVENSIDAGAGHITVRLTSDEDGQYIEEIQVVDDGCGMLPIDLRNAFGRHATSKLGSADELSLVRTLGFRGEALPSIASVSRVEMQSCAAGADCGYSVLAAEGNVEDTGEVTLSQGTRITVRGLFYNTPARKKFLKSYATETGLVSRLIGELILSRPDIAFTLQIDGRMVLRSPGGGSLDKAVLSVYGAQVMAALRPVSFEQGDVRVAGFVSMPPFARSSRRYYHFFVNGRLVRSKELGAIIDTAYHSLMPEGRHPLVVLYLDLPTGDVDVNVHPAKTEIRFKQLAALREAVLAAVRRALAVQQERPSAPSGQNSIWQLLQQMGAKPVSINHTAAVSEPAPETADLKPPAPEREDDYVKSSAEDNDLKNNYLKNIDRENNYIDAEPVRIDSCRTAAEDALDFANEPVIEPGNIDNNNGGPVADEPVLSPGDDPAVDLKKLSTPQEVTSLLRGSDKKTPDFASKLFQNLLANAPGKKTEYRRDDGDWLAENFGVTYMEDYNKPQSAAQQLFGADSNIFLALKPLGQLNNSYIIAALNEDLYIIDQHAAHERILYEEFSLAFLIDNKETSLLAVPVSVDVGDLHAELLLNNITRLADFGFVLEHFGGSSFVLRGVPLWFVRGSESLNQRKSEIYQSDCKGFFLDIFDMLLETAEDETLDIARLNRLELFTKACKSAIKANQRLNGQEISWLLHNLAECDKPQTCPHGRPTYFKMTDAEIRRRFMRG